MAAQPPSFLRGPSPQPSPLLGLLDLPNHGVYNTYLTRAASLLRLACTVYTTTFQGREVQRRLEAAVLNMLNSLTAVSAGRPSSTERQQRIDNAASFGLYAEGTASVLKLAIVEADQVARRAQQLVVDFIQSFQQIEQAEAEVAYEVMSSFEFFVLKITGELNTALANARAAENELASVIFSVIDIFMGGGAPHPGGPPRPTPAA